MDTQKQRHNLKENAGPTFQLYNINSLAMGKLTSSCKLQLQLKEELVLVFALYTHHNHHHPPPKLYFAVSQLPVVGFEHVRTLFDSTHSQESKSDISSCNRTRQCTLGPILSHTLYQNNTGHVDPDPTLSKSHLSWL